MTQQIIKAAVISINEKGVPRLGFSMFMDNDSSECFGVKGSLIGSFIDYSNGIVEEGGILPSARIAIQRNDGSVCGDSFPRTEPVIID